MDSLNLWLAEEDCLENFKSTADRVCSENQSGSRRSNSGCEDHRNFRCWPVPAVQAMKFIHGRPTATCDPLRTFGSGSNCQLSQCPKSGVHFSSTLHGAEKTRRRHPVHQRYDAYRHPLPQVLHWKTGPVRLLVRNLPLTHASAAGLTPRTKRNPA